jgi:acyl carrier protein
VDSSRAFADYGLDSVKAVELAYELENWLGEHSGGLRLDLGATIAWNFPTIDALARYLAGASNTNHDTFASARGARDASATLSTRGHEEHEGDEGSKGTLRETSYLRGESLEPGSPLGPVSLDGADFAELLKEELEAVKRRRST